MNIMLDSLDFDKPWGFSYFKNIIKPDMKITYLPLAFHEDWISNESEWNSWYGRYAGSHHDMFTRPFLSFGIGEDNIEYVNYFIDDTRTATEKIKRSDIIIFAGGMPEKIVYRLKRMNLLQVIENYRGIIMGWSAGSMIQCEDYYISPDEDYPEYVRCQGLKGIRGFAVETHYQGYSQQIESINRYIRETGNNVYTTTHESAIIVDDGNVTLLGNAREYSMNY